VDRGRSSYNPAQPAVPPKEQCKTLTAKVSKKDDGYQATFEGDCGRPYKYSISMEGRAAGKASGVPDFARVDLPSGLRRAWLTMASGLAAAA
jgi:hypothetical protein